MIALTSQKSEAPGFDPRLDIDNPIHKKYVNYIALTQDYYEDSCQAVWDKTNDWWELFLAQQEDTREADENWRSDVFVPLPYSTTRTKAAQLVEVLGNTEPIWQVEATRETGNWFQQSQGVQRLLDYDMRMNRWRRFLYKLITARSVQGTTWMKAVWGKKAHLASLNPTAEQHQRFLEAVTLAQQAGAPDPPNWVTEPELFEKWRDLINTSGKGNIPAPPRSGEFEVIEYEGPIFQQLPLWRVYVDPMVDEVADQKVILHRIVKPINYVLNRADDDPNSDKPYLLRNVKAALQGFDGEILHKEQNELAQLLDLTPATNKSHPYYEEACQLDEVWSPEEPFVYSIIMNERYVINKKPFHSPLLTSCPNLFALRNAIVPGHFYGLSDYQEPEKLFRELNSFRRLRMDGAMLTTLPAFIKQQGLQLSESLRKLKPGAIYTAPTATAIQSLIRHTMPPEAYREPVEIKLEIEDATEVYSSTKGAPATVGRVTGTEFQGRSNMTTLKFKIDASLVEEELLMLPSVMLSLHAQLGGDKIRREVGGDPDAVIDVPRDKLIQMLNARFRFRGATKNIQPDLAVQQITTAVKQFQNDLTPAERRAVLQLIMEMLDIRGYSKILTNEGTQQMEMAYQQQAGAQASATAAGQMQTDKAQVATPASVPVDQMGGA